MIAAKRLGVDLHHLGDVVVGDLEVLAFAISSSTSCRLMRNSACGYNSSRSSMGLLVERLEVDLHGESLLAIRDSSWW